MIHQEVLKEWYGSVPYKASIEQQGVHFLGGRILPYIALPSTFQSIKTLNLSIHLMKGPDLCKLCTIQDDNLNYLHPFSFEDCVKALAECFSGKQSKLERLQLLLLVSVPLFAFVERKPGELRKAL